MCSILAGCTTFTDRAACPDISGTYSNRADGTGERLSALLLEAQRGVDSARAVTIEEDPDRRQIVVAAGASRGTLKHGADFVCDAQGLRLLKPDESGLDLGEVLVHRINTFHTLSKAPDGALRDSTSTKAHATVAGVPMAGPERPAATLRWRAFASAGAR